MKTLQQLQQIRESLKSTIAERQEGAAVAAGDPRLYVLVCGGTGCTSGNSKIIYENFKNQLAERGLSDEVKIILT
ncbi:MAG: (2Fe-2S) ferredoxin domain-containing protein, partial [Clostridiales bacterium]|nr:(2Fe-2S) ferredoxin domain-containing protein [Clostridiales bacterium]